MNKPSREEMLRVAVETGFIRGPEVEEKWLVSFERFSEALYTTGYAAGAEGMRELAAEVFHQLSTGSFSTEDEMESAIKELRRVSNEIRALPVTQANPVEGEKAERKDYCGSCGQWTGGPMVCCKEMDNKPDVTKTEAIAVRLAWKERRDDQV